MTVVAAERPSGTVGAEVVDVDRDRLLNHSEVSVVHRVLPYDTSPRVMHHCTLSANAVIR